MPLVRFSRPRKVAGLLVASAALVLSLAACGGSSDSSSTASSGGNPGNGNNTAFAAYTQCLAKNGVTITMPSGGARPSGFARPSGGAQASGYPRPSGSAGARGGGNFGGGGFGGGLTQKPANVDQATWDKATAACASVKPSFGAGGNRGGGNGADAAYRNCLQQHGVTMTSGKVDTTSSAYKTAEKTCAVLKPTASPSPTA